MATYIILEYESYSWWPPEQLLIDELTGATDETK